MTGSRPLKSSGAISSTASSRPQSTGRVNKRNRQHPSNPGKDNYENGHQCTTAGRNFRDRQGNRDFGADRHRLRSHAGTAWSGRADARRQAVPDENRTVARRTLVPRPRQQFRPPLGPCAGHQAADAPGDLRAVDDVVPGAQSPAIPLEGGGGRDAPCVPPPRHGIDPARTSRRIAQRLGALAGAHSRAGRTQESEGDTTMSAYCDAASDRKTPTWVRRVREICAWVLPNAILGLVPKCPACLAAHVTLSTVLGLSLSTAPYLRSVRPCLYSASCH